MPKVMVLVSGETGIWNSFIPNLFLNLPVLNSEDTTEFSIGLVCWSFIIGCNHRLVYFSWYQSTVLNNVGNPLYRLPNTWVWKVLGYFGDYLDQVLIICNPDAYYSEWINRGNEPLFQGACCVVVCAIAFGGFLGLKKQNKQFLLISRPLDKVARLL